MPSNYFRPPLWFHLHRICHQMNSVVMVMFVLLKICFIGLPATIRTGVFELCFAVRAEVEIGLLVHSGLPVSVTDGHTVRRPPSASSGSAHRLVLTDYWNLKLFTIKYAPTTGAPYPESCTVSTGFVTCDGGVYQTLGSPPSRTD